jgi:hypothetical protein
MSPQQLINSRADELTDTLQAVLECFPKLRADHRPLGADWYRWLIYDDCTSKVVGVIGLDEPSEKAMAMPDIKVLLRKRVLALVSKAA